MRIKIIFLAMASLLAALLNRGLNGLIIHLSLVNSALLVLPRSSGTDLRCHGGLFSFDINI